MTVIDMKELTKELVGKEEIDIRIFAGACNNPQKDFWITPNDELAYNSKENKDVKIAV